MCRAQSHGGRRCPGTRDGGAARRARARAAQARYRARTAQSGTSTQQFLDAVTASLNPSQLAAQWSRQLATLQAAGLDTAPATEVAQAALSAWRASTHAPGTPTGHGTTRRGAHEHRTPWRDDPTRLSRSATAEAARTAVDSALKNWIAEQTRQLDAIALAEAQRRVRAVQNTNLLTDEELDQARTAAAARTARVAEALTPAREAQAARRRSESNLRGLRELAQATARSRLSDPEEKAQARRDFLTTLETWAETAEPSPGFMDELTTWAKRDRSVRPAWLTIRARQLDGDPAAAQAELTELTRRR